MKRDASIDFYRGLAAISVILIHTVFWSGQEYTPQVLKTLVLLLDVPFFFFLSGETAGIHRNPVKVIRGLVTLWKKWIFFVLFAEILCLLLGVEGLLNLRDFVNNVFLLVSMPGLPVIKGSVWFLPVYFKVVFLVNILLALLEKFFADLDVKKLVDSGLALCFLGLMIQAVYEKTDAVFSYLLFYSFFYLLGYRVFEVSISGKKFMLLFSATAVSAKLAAYTFGKSLMNLQDLKFPPHVVYLIVSLCVVWIALYLKDRIKLGYIGRAVSNIGRNAIWFYFAQGISSSLLYTIVPKFPIQNWIAKVIAAFLANFIMAAFFAFLLYNIWTLLNKIARFFATFYA